MIVRELEEKWSCYDCGWSTDKCKNKDSSEYDNFLLDIKKCNLTGDVDNTLGSSWKTLGEEL